MAKITPEELLKDKRVIEEIQRHLWLESERVGFNIGFGKATEDWMKKFSAEWIRYNRLNAASNPARSTKKKSRSAKSYFQETR